MSDEPVPIRRNARARSSAPTDPIVQAVHASLRATDVYVRLLIDQIELACTSDLVQLDRVPLDVFVELNAVSDALQGGAHRTLARLDRDFAQAARRIANLVHDGVIGTDAPDGK